MENALKKSWVWVITAVLLLHLIGISRAFAADPKKPEEILLHSGTPVILEVESEFSSDDLQTGDTIVLRVKEPVRVKGVTVIRPGVAAKAYVADCKRAAGWGGAGQITIRLKTVEAIDGSQIRLSGRARRQGETEHGTATAVGVGAGILCLPLALTGFAVTGEEGKFPPGYEIVAHVDGDHYIRLLPEQERKKIAEEQTKRSARELERFKERLEKRRQEKETNKAARDEEY